MIGTYIRAARHPHEHKNSNLPADQMRFAITTQSTQPPAGVRQQNTRFDWSKMPALIAPRYMSSARMTDTHS